MQTIVPGVELEIHMGISIFSQNDNGQGLVLVLGCLVLGLECLVLVLGLEDQVLVNITEV